MYNSEYCLTLDEMPADLYSYEEDPNATTTTKVTTTTTTTTKDPNVTTTTTAYKFAIQKQTVAMEEGEKDTIVIKLSGAAGASIGGGIGFQVDDPENNNWKNIEWSGNADSDGNLEVKVDVSEIPAEDTSAEVQVWWSNTWDASAEKSIDQPYEIVSCTVNMKGASNILYGDATGECAFSEKFRMGRLVAETSSFRQKASAATWGCVIRRPSLVATMLGI